MTRIIAGVARGRRLRTPAGTATRPTSDRVREALFSSLEARLKSLDGTRFLDVFAGSGSVGLEARSRGAASVTLIESDRPTAAVVRANVRELGLSGVTVLDKKAETAIADAPSGGPFEVVFLDPPYTWPSERLSQLISDMGATGWLAPDAMVVVERSRRDSGWTWPPSVEPLLSKRYGETMLWYGRFSTG